MTRTLAFILLSIALLVATASAHLCNNIYRTPDRIVVKPEKDVTSIEKADEFRVFVKNNYPTKITQVRLTATSADNAMTVSVEPQTIPRMNPAEKAAFTLKVTVNAGAARSRHKLRIGISAKEVGFRPAGEASTQALRDLMKDGNPSPRVLAGESLVRRKDPVGYECIKGFITGRDREYRCRALRALGRTGDTSLVGEVRSRLSDRDGLVKGNALLALGMLKTDGERIRQFVNDRDPFVAACARAALVIQGDQSVVQYLRPGLEHENLWVRAVAAWGIASTGDRGAIQLLDQAFSAGDASYKAMVGDALVALAQEQRK